MKPALYLFDLDGTLVDSAPDLAASANNLRTAQGLEPMPYELLRPAASSGARGLLGTAFGITPSDESYAELEKAFLDYYQEHLADHAQLFPGIAEVLEGITQRGASWGIVTNKYTRFTVPLLKALNLNPQTLVCGDTINRRKPFPDPVMHAIWELDAENNETIYVGDDIRDIQAAHAAGIPGLVASWGYLGSKEPIEEWHADRILSTPIELLDLELPL
ncbi:MAG: HAD-IA family hydrolase [Burkholderiaceae bacterium]|nr:HAD-IA family hydrolase [Burkholderiaceae bacterium]